MMASETHHGRRETGMGLRGGRLKDVGKKEGMIQGCREKGRKDAGMDRVRDKEAGPVLLVSGYL